MYGVGVHPAGSALSQSTLRTVLCTTGELTNRRELLSFDVDDEPVSLRTGEPTVGGPTSATPLMVLQSEKPADGPRRPSAHPGGIGFQASDGPVVHAAENTEPLL